MSPAWEHLLWRSLPVALLLTWFLALIGGYGLGGLIHLLLVAAVAIVGFQLRSDAPA